VTRKSRYQMWSRGGLQDRSRAHLVLRKQQFGLAEALNELAGNLEPLLDRLDRAGVDGVVELGEPAKASLDFRQHRVLDDCLGGFLALSLPVKGRDPGLVAHLLLLVKKGGEAAARRAVLSQLLLVVELGLFPLLLLSLEHFGWAGGEDGQLYAL
jgi:hypothetical protein